MAAFAQGVVDSGRPQRTATGRRVTAGGLDAANLRRSGQRLDAEAEGEEERDDRIDDVTDDVAVDIDDGGQAREQALYADQEIERQTFENDRTRMAEPQTRVATVDRRFVPGQPITSGGGVGNAVGRAAPGGHILSPSVTGLYIRPPFPEDTDNLWDWIRRDDTLGQEFLGRPYRSSYQLHELMKHLIGAEHDGTGLIRAIHYQQYHLGFAMLSPILGPENTALMHLYLRPDMRGKIAEMIGSFMELAALLAPGVHLAVYPNDAVQAKLYARLLVPLGFQQHVMLIR